MTNSTVQDQEVDALLQHHVEAWTALSRLYLSPPDEDVLAQLRSPGMIEAWPLATDGDAQTRAGLGLVTGSNDDAEAVAADHRRLFVGPGRLLAAPYESVHVGEEKLLFDEATIRVREAYAAFGLAAPRLNREPDDHVGLELEFMATLARGAVDDPEQAGRYLTALAEFLTDHVGVWVPGFAMLVARQAQTDLWRGLGYLLAGTVEQAVRTFVPRGIADDRSERTDVGGHQVTDDRLAEPEESDEAT